MDLHSLRRQTETGCIDYKVLAFDEAEPPQFIEQRDIMRCIAQARQHDADAIDASGFLPLSDERPRRRAADERDEIAALHSMTSLAVICMISGTAKPIALAVLRLITRSNFVGCSMGRSPGFVPFSILST